MTSTRTFRRVAASGRGLGVARMSSTPIQRIIRRLIHLDIVPGSFNVRLPKPFHGRLGSTSVRKSCGV